MARIALGITLIFLFAAILSHFTGGGSAEAVQIYPTVEQCKAQQPAADCDKAFAGAQAQHDAQAPHYGNVTSCEDVYGPGQCVPRSGAGSSWFIPAMAGFVLGHALGASPAVIYQPVYVDRSGFAYSGGTVIGPYRRDCEVYNNCPSGSAGHFGGGGGYVFRSGGGSGAPFWSSGRYATRTVSVPRGGFGGSASISKPFGGSFFGTHATNAGGSSVVRGGFGSSAGAHASAGS
jgi:uncharacterized protein YgiB involved in biofilm formation